MLILVKGKSVNGKMEEEKGKHESCEGLWCKKI